MLNISVIIPVNTSKWNKSAEDLLKETASLDTRVQVVNINKGPQSIECIYDEGLAITHVIKLAEKLENKSDGILVYCFSDPGLHALKERLNIPVVGIGEASYITSLAIGERIGIISPIQCSMSKDIQYSRMLGLNSRIVDFMALNIPVLSLTPEHTKEKACFVVDTMIKRSNVDTIILGCGSIFGIDKIIEEKYKTPVIVPGKAGLTLLEGLIRMNIMQSKNRYTISNDE